MGKLNIIFVTNKRSILFEKFLTKLQPQTQAKVIRTIELLEKHGSFLPMPHAKKISSNLYELRTLGKQQVRIIYSIINKDLLLLEWFIKKTNKIPINIINKSKLTLHKYTKNAILNHDKKFKLEKH